MGVQATMKIGDKVDALAVSILSGEATYPGTDEVRIITILAAADEHRLADIQRAVMLCIDYARDNNIYTSSGSIAIVTNLNSGKAGVRREGIATNVVTGDVGLMVGGTVRNKGGRNITDDAHKQLLDWMNEQNRLAA